MKRYRFILGSVSCLCLIRSLAAQATPPAPASDVVTLNRYVVTGVFTETTRQDATVAVSSVELENMRTQIPYSGADLLKNVPGVFVNSALGEIRNMVYSRGVSANTSDGANGYYYVSLQEDGLPITNVNYSNYGPDYFHRPDVTLLRVEAVRGGSASITAANAPGGVFNYISQSGTANYGGEVRGRFGLEGDNSPYYRGDVRVGGPLGATGWLYSAGGFYRVARGSRDPGYPMNDGYQLKANLSKDYGSGSIRIYAKYLDDHNGWYEFLPAKNPNDPVVAPGVDRFGTNLHRDVTFTYPAGGPDKIKTFDSADLIHSRQKAVGFQWNHEFGDGWTLNNNVRLSRSLADWNTSAGVAIKSLNWANAFSTSQITYAGGPQNGRVPAGTYVFRDRKTNQVVATVTSDGTPRSGVDAGLTVVSASLPGADLETNGVWTNMGRVAEEHMGELMDQLALTKTLDRMSFTAGMFYGYSDISSYQTSAGRTIAPLVSNPEPLAITFTPTDPAWNGQTLQLTNTEGFMNLGAGHTKREAIQKQLAGFFGHSWEISNRFNADWGLRYETVQVDGYNETGVQNPRGNYDPTFGGADGDPLTVYDARYFVRNQTWNYDRSVDTFSWSAGLNYAISDSQSVYARYSNGEKAPDQQFFFGYNSQFRLDNLEPLPQNVEQVEVGYKFNRERLSLVVTPFYSKLSDVYSNPEATNLDGSLYYPDPAYNAVTTYGVELEADVEVTDHLSVRGVFTWQKADATTWLVFSQGNPGPADDRFTDLSGKPADNNPDLMVNLTPTYRSGKYTASLSWKYMGDRSGNAANVITLPAFSQFDLMVNYDVTPRFSLTLNVNNAFDSEGVMSWAGWGINSLDRQSFTTVPGGENQTLLIVPIQPRSYFLSATYRF